MVILTWEHVYNDIGFLGAYLYSKYDSIININKHK